MIPRRFGGGVGDNPYANWLAALRGELRRHILDAIGERRTSAPSELLSDFQIADLAADRIAHLLDSEHSAGAGALEFHYSATEDGR